jgi:hypothetical protein
MGGANGRDGHHPSEWDAMMYSVFVWVPRFRGWRRGSLYRGDGEEFLVHGEKKGGDREAAGDDFIPYMTIFFRNC